MKVSKKVVRNLSIFFATLIVLAALFVGGIYKFVFCPSFERGPMSTDMTHFRTEANIQKSKDDTEWFMAQNPEEIYITSFDGLKLCCLKLDAENAKGTFLMMHGYHSDPLREFASLARFYNSLGYNVLLPYERSHGKSEGKYITFGIKERYDLHDWIFEANKIYGAEKPLYLEGISMGCATTVMTLGFDDLPQNIKGVVADCGFTSPAEIIWKVLKKDRKLPFAHVIFALGNFFTNHLAGFDMNEYSTYEALKTNEIPVIFIHGTTDDFVPVEMSITNYQFCKAQKSLFLVADCPHAIAYLIDENSYHKKVVNFLGL